MAPEPWNKAHIPYPSALSVCKVAFNEKTAAAADSVLVLCENALKLFNSEVLQIEIRLLYRVMYVVNNSLRQHKPFCAIKQVKQCINRLEQMKLLDALRDLQELCPNSMQRDVGLEVGFCDVPSQPMLEWVCLKMLGAACLLSRTLDQCTKAFLLTRQHLFLSEFIILNFVLVSMLSRLWVFFRGILKTLGPLYQSTKDLLKEVMQYRPMVYLTDFTLPEDLASFLGFPNSKLFTESDAPETLGIKEVNKHSVLNKMFDAKVEKKVDEENKVMQMITCENVTSDADLGKALQRQDQYYFDSPSVLNIRSILLQTRGITKKHTVNIFSKTSTPEHLSVSASAALQQKEFLKLVKTATTFRQMAMYLEEMISWCRRYRLHQQRRCLAFILLWCHTMQNTECKSMSTKKKLQRICVRVQRVLHGKTLMRPSISSYWRAKAVLTTNFPTLMMRYGSIRRRCGVLRKPSRLAKNLFGVTPKPMFKHRGEKMNVTTHKDVLVQKDSDVTKNSATLNTDNDEIEDIFASIGFMM